MDNVDWNLELQCLKRSKRRQVRNYPARKTSFFVEFRHGLPGAGHREDFLTAGRAFQELRDMPPHPNVVRVIEWVDNDVQGGPGFHVVLESSQMTLRSLLQKCGRIPEEKARFIMLQLLKGVEHCHENQLLHGDIRPENLIIDEGSFQIKLTGFDIARPLWSLPVDPLHNLKSLSGCLSYQSPELLLNDIRNSPAVDIWSCACVFAEMLTGQLLFQGDNSESATGQLKSIISLFATPSEPEVSDLLKSFHQGSLDNMSDRLISYLFHRYAPIDLTDAMPDVLECLRPWGLDLLSRMLNVNPTERIPLELCLHHPYFLMNPEDKAELDDTVPIRLIRNYSVRLAYKFRFMEKDRIRILNATRGLSCLHALPPHPNIVSLEEWNDWDVSGHERGFHVVLRYQSTKSLKSFIRCRSDLRTICSILYQLLIGVAHCHSHGVLHGDIRPENLVVDHRTGVLQISEFDIARRLGVPLDPDIRFPAGFLSYQSPELLLGDTTNNAASDIWSVGCIFAELLLGKVMFTGNSVFQQMVSIFRFLGTPPVEDLGDLRPPSLYRQYPPQNLSNIFPQETVRLISGMLTINPANRFSVQDCLDDPLLADEINRH